MYVYESDRLIQQRDIMKDNNGNLVDELVNILWIQSWDSTSSQNLLNRRMLSFASLLIELSIAIQT